ncbi:MAG: ABC transporter ATP-binding protein [Caldilineae bacterium]|nr:MAG: ABC transporter ATP-binding protein [Caldilineae bacterium]
MPAHTVFAVRLPWAPIMSTVVEFDHVSKWFTLYHQNRTLQERVQDLFRPRQNRIPTKEQFWALRDVSFSVQEGETVGLVGANGSGKSTALKLIARILEPTQGAIRVDGRVSALLELGAGFHPDLTGRENVFLSGSLMGLSRQDMLRAFDEIVEFSEMEQFIDMPVKHYSSGMFMRLAFAVAVHVDPEILLVDEVLAVGDASFQRKCMEHIGQLKRAGVTIIMVSHDLETMARLCERIVWLEKGRVVEVGQGRQVVNNYVARVNELQQAALERQRTEEADEGPAVDGRDSRNDGVLQGQEEQTGKITRIEVLTGGHVSTSIVTGDDLTIRVHYRARQPITHPVFGLALHRDDGVHVTGPNTHVDEFVIDQIHGEGYIDYVLPHAPLMAGRYYISASLFDETVTLCHDYVHEFHSFLVQPRTVWDELGVVRFPAHWRIHQPEASPVQENGTRKKLRIEARRP